VFNATFSNISVLLVAFIVVPMLITYYIHTVLEQDFISGQSCWVTTSRDSNE